MRRLAILLTLFAVPAAAGNCDWRDPQFHTSGEVSDVRLRMSLDDAESLLLRQGYKRVEPAGDDAGRTFERRKDQLQQLTVIASVAGDGCVDYTASTTRALPKEPGKLAPPVVDVTERFSSSGGPVLYLSRFRALAASIQYQRDHGGGCGVSTSTVIGTQSVNESINICALLPSDWTIMRPLPEPNVALREKIKPPAFELLPD